MKNSEQNVVVVGGGILGVSIAHELSQRGAQVTVLEARSLGSGTTSTSYAWINANGKEPHSYYAINQAGIKAHQKFAADAGQAAGWFFNTGHLEIAEDSTHETDLRQRAEALVSRGQRVDELSAVEANKLEPALNIPRHPRAILHFRDEAHVFPQLYMAEAVTRLRASGVQIVEGAKVTSFDSTFRGPVAHTEDGSSYPADQVVVAAGRWTDKVVSLAGGKVPLVSYSQPGDVTMGFLARTNPLPVKLSRLVTTPWLNARPEGGGRLVIQALDLDATAEPGNVPGVNSELAEQFLSRLRTILYGTTGSRIEQLLAGQRPMPADGRTIASPVPDVSWMYAVATHSGVTLAPYLGKAVAGEVFGVDEPLLKDFRLTRFMSGKPTEQPRRPRKPGDQ